MKGFFFLLPRAQALVKSSARALDAPSQFAVHGVHYQKLTCGVNVLQRKASFRPFSCLLASTNSACWSNSTRSQRSIRDSADHARPFRVSPLYGSFCQSLTFLSECDHLQRQCRPQRHFPPLDPRKRRSPENQSVYDPTPEEFHRQR